MTRKEYLDVRDESILFAIKKRRHSKYLNHLFTQAFNSVDEAIAYLGWKCNKYFTSEKLARISTRRSVYFIYYHLIPRELAEILGTTYYTSITLKDGRAAAIRRRLEDLSLDAPDISKERIPEDYVARDYDAIDVRTVMSKFFHELERYDEAKKMKTTGKNKPCVSLSELFRVLLACDFHESDAARRLAISPQRVNQFKNTIFISIAKRIREHFPEFVEGDAYSPTWKRMR